jgi:hypothetical protein
VVTRLLVVVHDKCFENDLVVKSLTFALTNKIPVALLHEADADHGGCTFGSIINQCQPGLKQIVGFDDMKLFGPIAVQWSRGPHQPVSIRLLAKSLGARVAPPHQRLCGAIAGAFAQRRARSTQLPTELTGHGGGTIASHDGQAEVGWHHGVESRTGEAGTYATNPLHTEPGGFHHAAVLTRELTLSDRDIARV